MRPRAKTCGFTLAETVVATAILGMMGVMVAGTFGRAMDARDRAEEITSRYNQIRGAMLRMAREIQMAYLSEHRFCEDPRNRTVFQTESSSGGARLNMTTFSHYKMHADANESDQNEISYYVGRDPDPDEDLDESFDRDATVLLRREQNRIDEEPDEGGIEQVLAEGVTNLSFEFYNDKDDRWEDEWDTTDSEYHGRLPMFVSIKLKALGPDGKTEEEFITKTRVFLRKPIQIMGGNFVRCPDDD